MPHRFERTAVLVVLLTSAFWLPMLPPELGGSLRANWADLVRPVYQGVHWVQQGAGRMLSALVGIFSLEEENRILRYRLEALRAHEEVHRQLAQENARLRELLGFRAKAAWSTIPAEVIGREIGPWSRSLLVDRGTKDGVKSGMAVMTAVGLVGRVSDAGRSASRVALLTDPHFRVAAKIPEDQLFGLCLGTGRGECTLTYLPLDAVVEPGRAVTTAGGRSFAPGGIPLGMVRHVRKDPSEMFQTAGLKPAADPGRAEEVLIVLWPHHLPSAQRAEHEGGD